MSDSTKVLKQIKKRRHIQEEENFSRIGYWLVRACDGERFFVSEQVNNKALEKVCNDVLTDQIYEYWIDYCLGLDVTGKPAWCNLDFTDRFLD